MTSSPSQAPPPTRPRQSGPPLILPGFAFAALTVAGGVLGASGTRPGDSSSSVLDYVLHHHTLLIILGTITFGASIPLATWTATVYQRLRKLGVTAPGTAIAMAGGVLASAQLGISGLLIWTAAQTAEPGQPGVVRALTELSFATGGPGFTVPFALLIAGVAVPSLILRLTPRALAWSGLVIAVVGVLSTLALLTSALYPLVPISRFGGIIWVLLVSLLLPISRQRRNAEAQPGDLANA